MNNFFTARLAVHLRPGNITSTLRPLPARTTRRISSCSIAYNSRTDRPHESESDATTPNGTISTDSGGEVDLGRLLQAVELVKRDIEQSGDIPPLFRKTLKRALDEALDERYCATIDSITGRVKDIEGHGGCPHEERVGL